MHTVCNAIFLKAVASLLSISFIVIGTSTAGLERNSYSKGCTGRDRDI